MGKIRKLKLFSGTANLSLATEIADHIGVPLGEAEVSRFSDGEINIEIKESVRGADVFIIQPLSYPVNENIMELLILVDAVKRASAKGVNTVIPYYGYARQDRKTRAREPITAKLVADLLTAAGVDRVIAMDLHAGQIQGFFNIPFDHLQGIPIMAQYFKEKHIKHGIVVSPDLGGVTRVRHFAERMDMPIAIIDKRRPAPNEAEIMHIIGDVCGRTVIMVDDIIDTAGTITYGAEALMKHKAKEVFACWYASGFSGPAIERLQSSPIKEVIVTNTIELPKEKQLSKIKILSVARLIGDAIIRIHEELSVSKLFNGF